MMECQRENRMMPYQETTNLGISCTSITACSLCWQSETLHDTRLCRDEDYTCTNWSWVATFTATSCLWQLGSLNHSRGSEEWVTMTSLWVSTATVIQQAKLRTRTVIQSHRESDTVVLRIKRESLLQACKAQWLGGDSWICSAWTMRCARSWKTAIFNSKIICTQLVKRGSWVRILPRNLFSTACTVLFTTVLHKLVGVVTKLAGVATKLVGVVTRSGSQF